jgi:hypothetical protein
VAISGNQMATILDVRIWKFIASPQHEEGKQGVDEQKLTALENLARFHKANVTPCQPVPTAPYEISSAQYNEHPSIYY